MTPQNRAARRAANRTSVHRERHSAALSSTRAAVPEYADRPRLLALMESLSRRPQLPSPARDKNGVLRLPPVRQMVVAVGWRSGLLPIEFVAALGWPPTVVVDEVPSWCTACDSQVAQYHGDSAAKGNYVAANLCLECFDERNIAMLGGSDGWRYIVTPSMLDDRTINVCDWLAEEAETSWRQSLPGPMTIDVLQAFDDDQNAA